MTYRITIQNPKYSHEVFVWDTEKRDVAQDADGMSLTFPYRAGDSDSQARAKREAAVAVEKLMAGQPFRWKDCRERRVE